MLSPVSLYEVMEFHSSDVREDMVEMSHVLGGKVVELDFYLHVVRTVLIKPVFHVLHDDFHVGDCIVTGFDMVIAEVLCLVYRAYRIENLLRPESVHRVAGLFVYHGVEQRFFLLRSQVSREYPVTPVDSVFVVDSDERRYESDAFFKVSRLCDVIVACIVHYGWGSAVFLCE